MLAWAHGIWNPDEIRSVVKVATEELNPGVAENLEVFPGIHVGTDGAKWMMILSVASVGPDSSFVNSGNVLQFHESRSSTIYVPVEGQNTPVEVKIQPDVAERWHRLYPRNFASLSPAERKEYAMLAMLIGSQTGKAVYYKNA